MYIKFNFRKLHNNNNTVNPVYSERVSAVKIVNNNRVFTINVFNLTINERSVGRKPLTISGY
jgi:hypothetical protein